LAGHPPRCANATSTPNAVIIGIGYEGKMPGHPEWPEALILTAEELDADRRHVIKRPFLL